MKRKRTLVSVLMVVFLNCFALADVKPAGVFGDHMVLQRGRSVPVWGAASPGEMITVKLSGQEKSVNADASGKWIVYLDALKAGGPFEMVIAGGADAITFKDVYVGEVWLCSGQSNMDMTVAAEDRYWCGVINEAEEVAAAKYPKIRVFDVPFKTTDDVQSEVEGEWEICSPETAGHFSAVAYFFAREIHKKLKVPVGLVTTAYGASTAEAWTSRPALEANVQLKFLLDNYAKYCEDYDSGKTQEKYETDLAKWQQDSEKAKAEGKKEPRKPRQPKNPHLDQHSPCVLYNAMVAPLVPYSIRGALWYQGESNGGTAGIYDVIMETMIKDWRKAWGQGDFPFLYVQLASYGKPSDQPCKGGRTTRVREAQLKNLSIPNSAMTVTIDIGDEKNIHPKNKQDVGRRLALQARALVYGENKLVCSGPIYDHMSIDGNTITLYFKSDGSKLAAKDGKLNGFAIAGSDKEFIWADAKIIKDTIVVSASDIENPVAVRYAWDDYPVVSLYNKKGLPASPFRTDDF
ncbi:MAG: hypothetical protein JW912_04045 [Sedimentisphaerales bacterium]|nr:hypothetical protein [Sedimentisphaerales bacterium]